MIHIKRGRGPSFIGGVFGIVFAVVAFFMFQFVSGDNPLGMNAPALFKVVPVLFIFVGLAAAAYNFYNAGAKHRTSELDITTSAEEPDPINEAVLRGTKESDADAASNPTGATPKRTFPGEFCPFCGERVKVDFDYCPKCGKDI
jgi:hypothetical protein